MRALRSCDFCSEQAVGTFEVVPEELEPTEAERRRVVLCDSCRETLETLIEPLLDRAGADNSATSADNASDSAVPETDPEPDGPGSSSGLNLDTDGSPSDPDSDESDESSGAGGKEKSPNGDGFSKLDSDEETLSEKDGDEGKTSGEDADKEELREGDDEEAVSEVVEENTSGKDSDEEKDGSEDNSDSGTADGSTDGDTSADSRPPKNYGKVLRLLRNRDFPMARNDVVAIASNAYGLNTNDVEEIVDEAIERDEFVEQKGKLHRT